MPYRRTFIAILALALFAPPVMAQTYITDNFTGAGDILSHTGDSGSGWASGYYSCPANNVTLDGSGDILRSANTNSNIVEVHSTAVPLASTDYVVSANIGQVTATNTHPALLARALSDKECYYVIYNGIHFQLYYRASTGSATKIETTDAGTLGNGVTKTVSLSVTGTAPVTLSVSVAGTEIYNYRSDGTGTSGTATFPVIASAGTAGIHYDAGSDSLSPATGYRVSAFRCYSGSVPVATSYTIAGPSAGNTNVLSGPYTLALAPVGSTSASTVVSLADDGNGQFYSLGDYHSLGAVQQITSVTLSTATPSVKFWYRRESSGLASISVTNSGTLTDPSPLSYLVTDDVAGTYRIAIIGDSNSDINQSAVPLQYLQMDLAGWGLTSATLRPVYLTGLALSGQYSSTYVSTSPWWTQTKQIADLYNCTWYSYMIGTNDCAALVTPATYKANLTSTINAVVGAGDSIIVHYPPSRTDGGDVDNYLPAYCAAIDDLVTSYPGGNVLKGFATYWFTTNHPEIFASPSDKHFSAQGYQDIAAGQAEAFFDQVIP